LLSGGVGITPMMAMAHELVEAGTRDVAFIHACENGRVHAMGSEVRKLAADNANMSAHFLYRTPDRQDRAGVDYDTHGMVDQALLETLLPAGECDFYLCGPGPFMQAMYDMLHDMGVATDRIQYEFFGPASVLKPKGAAPKVASTNASGPQITFAKSGVTAGWDAESENLLEFAEDQGVMVDYSCRAGTCTTCKTKVLSGTVAYPIPPFEQPEDGYALLCCSKPDGDLELDV
jgi:ferredoxin-NADP reductase